MNAELRDRVVEWIAGDPDENDRATLQALLDADNEMELERRFSPPLTFGTAGLRGEEMAGPAGLSRATVRRATQGVIGWMNERGVDLTTGVVVGRDARHGSESFNDEVVAVLLGAGVTVYEMPRPLPTPFVPYALTQLGAAAGIMITASHNPPKDNGYKLYAADGAQIIPPDDEIVERLMQSPGGAILGDRSSEHHFVVAEELLEQYRSHMIERFAFDGGSDLAITYTPLHGVGGIPTTSLLNDAGYRNVSNVVEQFEPDGDFPTLPFPNPEEPGALDLAIATATTSGSTLILANDPDADRLGVAAYDGETWHVLRGDQIGWLLASSLLDVVSAAHQTLATSIVSSTLLEKMAASRDIRYASTLTGFKWIARAGDEHGLGFGYEEALGYNVDNLVGDKDGLSAALAVAKLATELAAAGQTVFDRLDALEREFGVHATAQLSFRAEGAEGIASIKRVVKQLSDDPPTVLGGLSISEAADLNKGWRGLLPTEGVYLALRELGRVIVRPSGTEPKVKAYVEITPPLEGTLQEQRQRADELIALVSADLSALLRF